MSLSKERKSFEKQVQERKKSQSDDILYKKEDYTEYFLHKLWQQRKGFLFNLTKCLNCANIEVELPNNYKEVFIIMKKIAFAIKELEHVTNEICAIAPYTIQRQANILLAENEACVNIVLAKCNEYANMADNLSEGQACLLLTNFSMTSPIFEKTIPKVQMVQTIPSAQESQVDPQILVVVNVNITIPWWNATEAKLHGLQVEAEPKRKLELTKQRN